MTQTSPLPSPTRSDGRRSVQRIVEAAATVWAANAGASLQEIADAAGVNRATLYRHFPTREALFDAVAPSAFAEVHRHLGALPTDGPALEVLVSLIEPFVGLGNRYAFVLTHATPEVQGQAVSVALSRSVEEFIVRGQRRGEIDPQYHPAYVAGLFSSVVKNAVLLVSRGVLASDAAIQQAERAFVKAMEVRDDNA